MCLLVQALLPHHLHPFDESRQIEDRLGLNEIGTSPDFLGQCEQVELSRFGKWVGYRTNVERHIPLDRLTTEYFVLVPQLLHHHDQLYWVDVIDPCCGRVIALLLVITRQAENIANP